MAVSPGTMGRPPQLAYDASERGQARVIATWPDHPELSCAIWLYEDKLDQPTAWRQAGDEVVLEHQRQDAPGVKVITRITPCPDGVEQVVTVEGETEQATRAINQVNPCFQFRQSPAFGEAPDTQGDYVDDFIARCFVFTDRGLTLLKDTQRTPCAMKPSRPDDRFAARANAERPWIQSYSPVWEPNPLDGEGGHPGWSRDRITYPIMGVVSRDGRYLAAVAWPETWRMNQLWLHCVHPWPCLLTDDYDPATQSRASRGKLYVLPNDSALLLEHFERDFPDWRPLAERPTRWQ